MSTMVQASGGGGKKPTLNTNIGMTYLTGNHILPIGSLITDTRFFVNKGILSKDGFTDKSSMENIPAASATGGLYVSISNIRNIVNTTMSAIYKNDDEWYSYLYAPSSSSPYPTQIKHVKNDVAETLTINGVYLIDSIMTSAPVLIGKYYYIIYVPSTGSVQNKTISLWRYDLENLTAEKVGDLFNLDVSRSSDTIQAIFEHDSYIVYYYRNSQNQKDFIIKIDSTGNYTVEEKTYNSLMNINGYPPISSLNAIRLNNQIYKIYSTNNGKILYLTRVNIDNNFVATEEKTNIVIDKTKDPFAGSSEVAIFDTFYSFIGATSSNLFIPTEKYKVV